MNCSEFNGELERLVEVRGRALGDSAAAHATECAVCRQRWCDHRLLETALGVWRPVSSPSLADAVIDQLDCDQSEVAAVTSRRANARQDWGMVVVVAACLMLALGIGLVSRFGIEEQLAQHSAGAPSAVATGDEPPVEVTSSMAAVLADFRSEYRELAAETTATARELAMALPAPRSTWIEIEPQRSDAPPLGPRPDSPGGVAVIGHSIGAQIGQAMDFLWVAVPGEPRG